MAVLSDVVTISHMWLFIFQLIKIKWKIQFPSHLATFHMFNRHLWLVATALDSLDKEYFCDHRKFCWTVFTYPSTSSLVFSLFPVFNSYKQCCNVHCCAWLFVYTCRSFPRSWTAGFGEYSLLLDIASLFFKMIVPVLTPTSIVAIAQCPYPYLLLSDSYMFVFMMGVNYWFQFALPWLIVRLSFFHVYLPFAFRELPVHIFAHFPAGLSSSYWVQEFLHLRYGVFWFQNLLLLSSSSSLF